MKDNICKKEHRNDNQFADLPEDQGGVGRHKCAGCAYELGYQDGLARKPLRSIDLAKLPESQAKVVRHKSPYAAYAKGYYDASLEIG
ncbi:hypothetical protein [Prolixibacter sp. NT017]|uniref:hypothetical protein n=1 Tax=Prolixibacter sp. NT017 TaxID=2652390 RepID=UPI001276CF93|nr:hypothetical protein [Prolixibacter sp. NT017]GET26830.1 hypothetical protein NT017_31590 [Prolixibacter sp. NT017]